jgi:hypothetical protein
VFCREQGETNWLPPHLCFLLVMNSDLPTSLFRKSGFKRKRIINSSQQQPLEDEDGGLQIRPVAQGKVAKSIERASTSTDVVYSEPTHMCKLLNIPAYESSFEEMITPADTNHQQKLSVDSMLVDSRIVAPVPSLQRLPPDYVPRFQQTTQKSSSTLQKFDLPPMEVHEALQALQSFMPYSQTPEKQSRYIAYLKVQASELALSDWWTQNRLRNVEELKQEVLEFHKSAVMLAPLRAPESRFVAASSPNEDDRKGGLSLTKPIMHEEAPHQHTLIHHDLDLTIQFIETKWVPVSIVCQLLNIAPPYPIESRQGSQTESPEARALALGMYVELEHHESRFTLRDPQSEPGPYRLTIFPEPRRQ